MANNSIVWLFDVLTEIENDFDILIRKIQGSKNTQYLPLSNIF
jgi:hypothetical protein